ncbi:MAG: ABC transporter substrate-binding protein, partial [Desulfovibrio sp.]|nr:ABC transporter substrate-binding protein [Desulfovibrio sp.]
MLKNFFACSVLALTSLALPLAASGGAREAGKIVVADANSTHHLNLYVAFEKGLFKKRGLNVEIKQTSSGVAAVVGGEADIVFNCPTGVITPIAKGQNITIIAQVKIPCTSVLVAPVNAPFKKPEDLNGRQLAGLSNTCCAVIAIRDTLKKRYNTEFTLTALAPGAALAALESNAVEGAILEEPFVAEALLLKDAAGKAKYRTFFDGRSAGADGRPERNLAGENPPCRTINANKDFVKNRAREAKAFIEAVDEADKLIRKNPAADDIVAVAQKYVPNVSKQAIINSNPKLGFQIKLDTKGLIGYA